MFQRSVLGALALLLVGVMALPVADSEAAHRSNHPTATRTPTRAATATPRPTTAAPSTQTAQKRLFAPVIGRDPTPTPSPTPIPPPTPVPPCPSTGQGFDLIPTTLRYEGPPPETNPDLNLSVRSWVAVNEARGLVDYNGGTDTGAPQLYSMFADDRTPALTSTHRVYDWDWASMRRGALLSNWPVTLLGLGTSPGETIRLPRRNGSDIYQGVYYALVVYAEPHRISLHYARNDYMAYAGGSYGLHLENVCVDPALVALYQRGHAGGRHELPALKSNQPFGTARGGEVLAAIRDTGTFMDPRSRKDWWAGRAALSAAPNGVDHTVGRWAAPTTPG
jgi:hypothetical protein